MAASGPLDKGFRGFPFLKDADESDGEENGVEGNNADNGGENDDPHAPGPVGAETGGEHASLEPQQQPPSNGDGAGSSQNTPSGTYGSDEASDALSCETVADVLAEATQHCGNPFLNMSARGAIAYTDNISTTQSRQAPAHARAMLGDTECSSPKVSKKVVQSQRDLIEHHSDDLKHDICFDGDKRGGFEYSNAVRSVSMRQHTTGISGPHKAQGVPETGASHTLYPTVPRTRTTQVRQF
ncbi:hypothetical protein BDV93DRAFT_507977 [Ceratobasidium sp. AG-I]|nr:hypothetical protein BDV93DRAFT_507977 [Ceratobasidium sp. AG-I]